MERLKNTLRMLALRRAKHVETIDITSTKNDRNESSTIESKPNQPRIDQTFILTKLPLDLLLEVLDHLPLESAVALAFTCQPLYTTLGHKYLKQIKTSRRGICAFLSLREHDFDDRIFCSPCATFHKIKKAAKFAPHKISRCQQSGLDYYDADLEMFVSAAFSKTIFRMLMKDFHHFGRNARTSKLLKLLPRSSIRYESEKPKFRINNGSLFLAKKVIWREPFEYFRTQRVLLEVCPHLACYSMHHANGVTFMIFQHEPLPTIRIWSILAKKSANGRISYDYHRTKFNRCQYCETEFEARVEHVNSSKLTFTCRLWKDLGEGLESEKWRRHLEYEVPVLEYPAKEGSIAAVFGQSLRTCSCQGHRVHARCS